jgi:hypothetical protein
MIRFFSSTGFLLAPVQVLERDTSPLREEIREVGSVEAYARSRMHAGGDYHGTFLTP